MKTTGKMGLTSWDQPTDNYNYAQLAGNWQTVDFHDHSPGHGVPISANGLASGSVTANAMAAGAVGAQNLTPTLAADLGINAGANVGRGVTVVPTAQSTSSGSYTFLSTPDQVTGITITAPALVYVTFLGQWKVSAGAASIGLFMNNGSGWTQVTYPTSNATTVPVALPLSATGTFYGWVESSGTFFNSGASTTANSAFPAYMALGVTPTVIPVFVSGTYSFGVQVYAAGTITMQNRYLWVRTENYL